MEGLRQDLRILRRLRIGVERNGREPGDEHHLDVRVELGGAARQLDPIHLRHHDVGEKQFERLFAKPVVGGEAIVERGHVVAGVLQRLHEKAAHVVVVFGQQDTGHQIPLAITILYSRFSAAPVKNQ